ncbi:MAG: hypothetical protein QM569_14770 [Acidovorax sp.]|uniref:hypothetical protein n=1 Tax=Acidovorax sp. TaxID=1872122 RepID=UPI0039E21956
MAKGITLSCGHIWRGIARAGGWWSLLRVAREWDGVFGLAEIEEHLTTLARGGFLEATQHQREGTVYAYTTRCHVLPGDGLVPVTPSPSQAAPAPMVQAAPAPVVQAPQRDVMRTFYTPPKPTYRPGALDYERHPSLHMGQRRDYRSEAASTAPQGAPIH